MYLGAAILQLGRQLIAVYLVQALKQFLDVSELFKQLSGSLRPHAGHSRYIVGAVADQRLIVSYLVGADTVFVLHFVWSVKPRVAQSPQGGQHADLVINQLQHVAIAGDDEHFVADLPTLAGNCADDIIGLVSGCLRLGHTQGINQLVGQVKLGNQRLISGRAACFIVFKQVITESLTRGIESHQSGVGRFLLQ